MNTQNWVNFNRSVLDILLSRNFKHFVFDGVDEVCKMYPFKNREDAMDFLNECGYRKETIYNRIMEVEENLRELADGSDVEVKVLL